MGFGTKVHLSQQYFKEFRVFQISHMSFSTLFPKARKFYYKSSLTQINTQEFPNIQVTR